KPDGWYLEIAKRVYRPDIYFRAAEELVKEHGISRDEFPWESDGYRRQSETFFDGTTFDASQPNAYIDSFAIGLKGAQRIESEQVVQ
ncbi:MAG: nitrate ABC transporter substrate-binding protein, partial [Pseudomonadota bacterium]